MYVFGKGKSSTSVSVSQDVVSKGSTILIKGSVLGMSPAQPGTPCVSKESMATWMEYLHNQMPINGIFGDETITGVPVTLTAIAEGGSYFDIGTVVTEGFLALSAWRGLRQRREHTILLPYLVETTLTAAHQPQHG